MMTGEDGEDVVELMITKGKRFDIVLLDENMRRMNGSAATLLLRKHESANGLPSTPVLVTTGAPSTGRQLYSSIPDHPCSHSTLNIEASLTMLPPSRQRHEQRSAPLYGIRI